MILIYLLKEQIGKDKIMEASEQKVDLLTWKDLQNHTIWWARQMFYACQFFLNVWRRHKLLTISIMGFFILSSLGILYMRSNEYEMTTTFAYGDLHPKIFGDMVDKLNSVIQNGQTAKAGQLMRLSTAQAEKILEVKVSDTRGKPLTTNYNLGGEPMIVTLKLSEPLNEDSLRQGITYYLNSDLFTSERLDVKKRLLQEELRYIDVKLMTIDSILTNLYSNERALESPQGSINIENAEGKNAYELLSFSRELLQRKSAVENALIRPENVIALDNFLLLPRARFGPISIIVFGVAGAIIGFLLSSIIVFWREKLFHLVV